MNLKEVEFGDGPGEQTVLFDGDDAFIGDDPGIKIIVDERGEEEQPDAQVIGRGAENKDGI